MAQLKEGFLWIESYFLSALKRYTLVAKATADQFRHQWVQRDFSFSRAFFFIIAKFRNNSQGQFLDISDYCLTVNNARNP